VIDDDATRGGFGIPMALLPVVVVNLVQHAAAGAASYFLVAKVVLPTNRAKC
jgi:hypothetical protein